MNQNVIYLDHHATTSMAPEALEAMLPFLRGLSANPSSVHAPGRAARRAVEEARGEVARILGAEPSEIVFTGGGTESDVLAVCGGARAARAADPRRVRVLTSATEHAAVREAARSLASEGFEAIELAVDTDGLVRSPVAIDGGVALVSVILANNETGALNAGLPAIAAGAREHGAVSHTDAVQAVGKIPVDVRALGVDLLSLTAHKFGGPKGVGALYVRNGTRLAPLAPGGGQETGRRGGTENVAGIVGLAAALRAAAAHLDEQAARLAALRDRLERELAAAVPGIRFNATRIPTTKRLPTVSSVIFPGVDGETLLAALDLEGIAASSGSACHAGTTAPSRVLLAAGLSPADARGTLRFSFGRSSQEADVDRVVAALATLVPRVRDGS